MLTGYWASEVAAVRERVRRPRASRSARRRPSRTRPRRRRRSPSPRRSRRRAIAARAGVQSTSTCVSATTSTTEPWASLPRRRSAKSAATTWQQRAERPDQHLVEVALADHPRAAGRAGRSTRSVSANETHEIAVQDARPRRRVQLAERVDLAEEHEDRGEVEERDQRTVPDEVEREREPVLQLRADARRHEPAVDPSTQRLSHPGSPASASRLRGRPAEQQQRGRPEGLQRRAGRPARGPSAWPSQTSIGACTIAANGSAQASVLQPVGEEARAARPGPEKNVEATIASTPAPR